MHENCVAWSLKKPVEWRETHRLISSSNCLEATGINGSTWKVQGTISSTCQNEGKKNKNRLSESWAKVEGLDCISLMFWKMVLYWLDLGICWTTCWTGIIA